MTRTTTFMLQRISAVPPYIFLFIAMTTAQATAIESKSELERTTRRNSIHDRAFMTSYKGEELIKPWDLRGVWSEFSQIKEIGIFTPVIRSMQNYAQLVGLLTFVNSQAMRDSIAGRVMDVVSSINVLSFDFAIDIFSSVDCNVNTPLARTIMSMLLPISAWVTIGFMILIGRLICSGIGLSECVRACCFTGMLLYTATISDILSNITPVAVDGQRYVFRDTSVDMDSSSHSAVVAVSLVYCFCTDWVSLVPCSTCIRTACTATTPPSYRFPSYGTGSWSKDTMKGFTGGSSWFSVVVFSAS